LNSCYDVLSSTVKGKMIEVNEHLDQNVSIDSTQGATAHEHHLILVRAIWWTVALLAFGFIAVGVPSSYAQFSTVSPAANTLVGQLRPDEAHALEQAGVSVPMYAVYLTALETLFTLVFVCTGLVIVWFRPMDRAALLISLSLIGMGLSAIAVGMTQPRWHLAIIAVHVVWYVSSLTALYLFPDGRFVPRWTRWLTAIWLIYTVAWLVFPAISPPFGFSQGFTGSELPRNLWILIWICSGLAAQIYRYRHVSTATERQQIKWVEFGFASFVILWVIGVSTITLARLAPMGGTIMIVKLAGTSIVLLGELTVPFCLGISILRYQLFDINILINRTLVYGTLTASVVGIYVLIVGGLGAFLQTQNNLPGIVIAVLLIAFLFQPLHRCLQDIANHFVPVSQTVTNQSITASVSETEQVREVPVIDRVSGSTVRGRWLPIVRWAWITGFIALTLMYVFGFLAVHEALSTVCEEKLCTLRLQIRHTEAGEQVMDWGGPPEGFADPLRRDQLKVLEPLGLTLDQYGWLGALQLGIPALVYLLIAAGLFWWKSDDWMVLFMSTMVMTLPFVDMPLPYTVLVRQPIWQWIFIPADFVAVSSFFIFPLVFPTGRFVPRWTRWKAFFDIAFAIYGTLSRNYILKLPPSWDDFLLFYIILSFVTNAYAQSYRYFRVASPIERQQIKWVVVGVVGFVSIAIAVDRFLYYHPIITDSAQALLLSVIPDTIYRAITLFIPVSIAISVLRYRLWNIDILINRTLVYGTLTAGIIGIYVLVVGVLGTTIQERGNLLVSILTTGLIAVMAQPLRDRLQRGVNRLLYGERDDPVTVLSRLGQRLEATLAPDAVLPSLVETVAQTLKLPYVAIEMTNTRLDSQPETDTASINLSSPIISYGTPQPELIRLPLIYQSETIGQLIVSPRAQDEKLSPMDRHLLENIAHQAGMAVHAVSLTTDLQRSRQNLVTAREEERRRLRRDLHDGLGPNLASQGLKLAAVKQLLENNPTAAIPLLDQVMSQNKSTVDDVRRLVYGLRPPALDELGLVAAIRDHVAGMDGKSTLQIEIIEPSEGLPTLSAAVEVAAYRIVLEAVTNVIHHAQAKHCAIRFAVSHNGSDNDLQIEIQDDGKGMPEAHRAGIGLRSMRERAEEIGGTCIVESNGRQGTCVSMKVPLIRM
jgi:signal transduction histidine kinase